MNKLAYILSGLLLVQLIMSEALYWTRQQEKHKEVDVQQALLFSDVRALDKIQIQEGDKHLTLQKNGQGWVLAETQLPVDKAKMDGLLAKLETLNGGWPVTSTAASHERFEVTKKRYQRHVTLYQGDAVKADFYLGSSPGFRKVHLRKLDHDAVYAVALNVFEFPVRQDEWLDKRLLAVEGLKRIETSDYQLEKQQSAWVLNSSPQASLNQTRATDLATAFENLRVTGRIEHADAEQGSGDQTMNIKVNNDTGEWSYSFVRLGSAYAVKRSDMSYYFGLSESDYQRFVSVTATGLQENDPVAPVPGSELAPEADQ